MWRQCSFSFVDSPRRKTNPLLEKRKKKDFEEYFVLLLNNRYGDSVLSLSSILLEEKPILSSRRERRRRWRDSNNRCGDNVLSFVDSPREEKEENVEEIWIKVWRQCSFSFVDSPREEKEENVKEIWITGVETVFFLYRRFSSKKNSPIPLSSPSTNRGLTNSSLPQLMSRGGEEECTLGVQWQSDRSSSRWTDIPTE